MQASNASNSLCYGLCWIVKLLTLQRTCEALIKCVQKWLNLGICLGERERSLRCCNVIGDLRLKTSLCDSRTLPRIKQISPYGKERYYGSCCNSTVLSHTCKLLTQEQKCLIYQVVRVFILVSFLYVQNSNARIIAVRDAMIHYQGSTNVGSVHQPYKKEPPFSKYSL